MDEGDYLRAIGQRVEFYFDIRKEAVKYILENNIRNKELTVSIMLIGAAWGAHQLDEDLTEEDMLILFGLVSNTIDNYSKTVIKLHPDQTELTLQEIFDLTVESYK